MSVLPRQRFMRRGRLNAALLHIEAAALALADAKAELVGIPGLTRSIQHLQDEGEAVKVDLTNHVHALHDEDRR